MRRFLSIAVALFMVSSMAAKNVIWVIDAGHGGHDVGCEFGDVYEKDITLAVAKEVGRLIGKNISGVRVVYTREKNKFLSLQERCNIANARGAELFLSIHVNAAPNQFARGTESFFATNVPLKGSQAGKSELLALLLQKHYLGHGREVSRGVKKRELYVCENTTMPGVLTEVGFITNSQERDYITSAKGQAELAEAIVDALAEWKKLTADGKVHRQTLRNLHFTHYDPRTEPAKSVPAATTPADKQAEKKRELADAKAKEAAEAKVIAEAQAEEQAKAQAQQPAAAEATAVTATGTTPTAAADSIAPTYFAIQLMNTAKPLPEGDHRLKGFQGVRFIPAGDRFKGIYSHSDSYLDIKNELVQVRETFPEAFIVAFRGDQQITTAEAIQLRAR